MECDTNVGLWKIKEKMETSKDFVSMIENSRTKPSPFVAVNVSKQMVFNLTELTVNIFRNVHLKHSPLGNLFLSFPPSIAEMASHI